MVNSYSNPLKLDKIRLIPYQAYAASFNMLADLYLMHTQTMPCLRFYGFIKPSLSFGKSNQTTSDIDMIFCKNQGFDFVVRPSGGKTVFHYQELTYSLTCPPTFFTSSILETYRFISQSLISALAYFGTHLSMQFTKHGDGSSSNCFNEVSSWEVNHLGKKIIGSAQVRKNSALLQHGSILLSVDYDLWAKIWPGLSVSELKKRLIGLDSLLESYVTPLDLSFLLTKNLKTIWDTTFILSPFSDYELNQIQNF